MSLLNTMGVTNGFTDFLGGNRSALTNLGFGMIGAKNFSEAAKGAAGGLVRGQPIDNANAIRVAEEATRKKQIAEEQARQNKTLEFLKTRLSAEDFAAVDAGVISPSDAFKALTAPQATGAPFTLSAGQTRYGPNGEVIAQSNPAEVKPTSGIAEYEYAVQQGFKGSLQDYQLAKAKAGASNVTMNANQGTAAAYADRMLAADQILNDPKIIAAQTNIVEQGKAGVPLVGNFLTSEEKQMADQAERDFINSILRRESGAVISPSEFDNARKQYLPQPGDSVEVIKQKAANRKIALQGVARAAGGNYQPPQLMPQGAVDAPGVVDFSDYF